MRIPRRDHRLLASRAAARRDRLARLILSLVVLAVPTSVLIWHFLNMLLGDVEITAIVLGRSHPAGAALLIVSWS
ncbi:hypothetical protein [Sphingomonas sp. UYP23]